MKTAFLVLLAALCRAQSGPSVAPGGPWEKIARPEDAGYSAVRLEAMRAWLKTIDTTSMVVVYRGRILFEYGDVARQSYLASVRKSILATLYGNYVASGKIRLDATLEELDMDDVGGLLPSEKKARVEDLITARSGVFHPASYPGDDLAQAPPRGTQKPGSYHLYSNWDFNAAGYVFEKMTGIDIYDALEKDLARPIAMQDFDRSLQKKEGDEARSIYKAYPIWLSTRDMARFGLLISRGGDWAGKQLVPKDWVRKITSLVTPTYDMNPPSARGYGLGALWGYGYMWWVWDDHRRDGPFAGAYTGIGAVGQYITVLPKFDLVIAHKTVPAARGERPRGVSRGEYQAALLMLVAAHCGDNCRAAN